MSELPSDHPKTESDARLRLEELGCYQPVAAQLTTRFLPATIAAITLIVISVVVLNAGNLARLGIKIEIGNILVAAAMMFAVFQWRVSLEKDALEKYQTEIKEANAQKEKWPAVREMMSEHHELAGPKDDEGHQRSRYVYLQLDNLEFAVERYMQGFTSAYTASRAVQTFQSKCQVPLFRALAMRLVIQGSYSVPVQRIVAAVGKLRSERALLNDRNAADVLHRR